MIRKKQRLFAQQRAALGEQLPEVILEPPHFARAAAAVGRRVHDDRVVLAAALDFAAHEFQAVVGDVANGRVGEPAERGVFAAPFHHALGGVDVADGRAGLRGGDRRGAGVAEEIEHGDFAPRGARGFDFSAEPVPVHRLLGKEPGVLEGGGMDLEREPSGRS